MVMRLHYLVNANALSSIFFIIKRVRDERHEGLVM